MLPQSFDILTQKHFGLNLLYGPRKFEEKGASRFLKATAFPGIRERLARESA